MRYALPIAAVAALALVPASTTTAARLDVPELFQELLVRYDKTPSGPEREELERGLDMIAHQKYAHVSRLYWYTDLREAQDAARTQNRPILHLRMLGRLDEDLSCANSRLFRATLYANAEVSRLLRDKFVLYWSSERPVPKVTIDLGDGRRIERTTTGNSAHYVMDAEGRVLDVLPGLYAPAAFKRELEASLVLAATVRALSPDRKAGAIVAYHQAKLAAISTRWNTARDATLQAAFTTAQRQTVSKAYIEVPDQPVVVTLAERPDLLQDSDVIAWTQAAMNIYAIGTSSIFDARSLDLIYRLHDGALPAALRATKQARSEMVTRLQGHILGDTGLDEIRLRPQISRHIVETAGTLSFDDLNTWVYSSVFLTPASDPWIGLLPRTDFTGLPGDGVAMP